MPIFAKNMFNKVREIKKRTWNEFISTPSKQAVVTPMLKKRSGKAKLSFGPQSKPNSVIKFSSHLSRVYFGVSHSQISVTFGSLQSATGSSIRNTF